MKNNHNLKSMFSVIVLPLVFHLGAVLSCKDVNKSPDVSPGISASTPGESLAEKIRKHQFSSSGPIHALQLSFKEKRYVFTYGSEGHYWHNEGQWKINGEKVRLQPDICKADARGPDVDLK